MGGAALTMGVPVLGVADVKAAAFFVRDKLGFRLLNLVNEPATFAILERDGVELFLQRDGGPGGRGPRGWSTYLRCRDADGLCAELSALGAPVSTAPHDQPYGCREFEVAGPENHIIVFGQNI